MKIAFRQAVLGDLAKILELYSSAYAGTYPDPTFTDVEKLRACILDKDRYIFVAESEELVVGSILFLHDNVNLLAKSGAAVVLPEFRGHHITRDLIKFGCKHIEDSTNGYELLYVTARTVHKAAQVLTDKLGFKQLGIFPNVHKTSEYETHALGGLYSNTAFNKRYTDFEQHPVIAPLYKIVQKNCSLPSMKTAQDWKVKHYDGEVPLLEVIEAKAFIANRMKHLKENNEIDLGFFPFHAPTHLLTSADQNVEVFAYVNDLDKYCVILGCKMDREVSFTDLFLSISNILRDRGVRYIEVIIRANRLNIIDKLLKSKFIPCGYVPAFQYEHNKRYDYVVFSRSFEILDFNNLALTGQNELFLRRYVELWEQIFLGKKYVKGFSIE